MKFISWKIEDEISNGNRKVYEIEGYKGLYKNSDDKLIDLRPEEGKPSVNAYRHISNYKLADMYYIALTNQIKSLQEIPRHDPKLIKSLEGELLTAKKI